jgi:hypothetical protein
MGAEADAVTLVIFLEIMGNIDSTTCIPTFDAHVRVIVALAVAALGASATAVARSTGVPALNRFVVVIDFALLRIATSLKNGSAFSCIKVILPTGVTLFLSSIHFLFFSSQFLP